MVHRGERVRCSAPGCDKTYSNLTNLRRHERDNHNNTSVLNAEEVRRRRREAQTDKELERLRRLMGGKN